MAKIVVEVMPKAELLDPQGKAIAHALARGGNTAFSDVRVGKRFELQVAGEITPETLTQAQQLAEKAQQLAENMLSNSVIEDVVAVYEEAA